MGKLFSSGGPNKWARVIEAYNYIRQPLGNKVQQTARKEGFYHELNAPEFEDVTMGQVLTPGQLSILSNAVMQSWTWSEDDIKKDMMRGVEFLNEGSE